MVNHRDSAKQGITSKIYTHMRDIGIEHFKILLVREYKDISKDRLKYKEDKYIKRFDTVKKGLNMYYSFGKKCEHKKRRGKCIECQGSQICEHKKRRETCIECKGSALCIHQKQKLRCKICSPAVCENCNRTYAGKHSLKTHQIKCKSNITE